MSLVAYGASDDSETSDVEESETSKPTESGEANDREFEDDGKISDEDDYVPTGRIQSAPSSSSNHTNVVVSSTNEIGLNRVTYTPSALSDLPAPKAATSASQGGEEGEDELEEELKPKASQLADAPKPPPPKKAKQPARIVLPALKKDSDDEEDDSQKKPRKQPAPTGASGSRSGLFALLPAPTHTSRKQANRPLIPYTLTKRPSVSKPSPSTTTATTTTTKASPTTTSTTTDLPSQKHQSAFNALTGYESDSDDKEGGGMSANFFSIGNEAEGATPSSSGLSVVKNSAPTLEHEEESRVRIAGVEGSASGDSTTVQSTSSYSPLAPKPVSTVLESSVTSSSGAAASASEDSSNVSAAKTQDSVQDSGDDDDDEDDDNEVSSTVGVPQVDQDAPLTFSSSMQNRSWSTAPLTSPMFPEMYAAPLSGGASSYWQRQQHYAQDYNTEEEQQQEASSSSSHDIQHYMEDEQFLRISGKRKRGQEDIQIIDANVDDHVDPSELMKGISEESSYQPHRKKENMPSMQQKRKKQITYLAFQAKERELELKNAWSQNRMTKNQARSKYGF